MMPRRVAQRTMPHRPQSDPGELWLSRLLAHEGCLALFGRLPDAGGCWLAARIEAGVEAGGSARAAAIALLGEAEAYARRDPVGAPAAMLARLRGRVRAATGGRR